MVERAAALLRPRPALFRFAITNICSGRHMALGASFARALSGAGAVARAIELHAGDPGRRVV